MAYLDSLVEKAKGAKPEPSVEKAKDSERELVDEYGEVKIWRVKDDPVMFYEVPTPHYRGEEKKLIHSLMDIAVNVMPPVYKGLSQDEKEQRYLKEIIGIIDATPELKIPVNSKEFFARAVVREMVGYGMLDPLTKDDWLEEIMVNGPNQPVFVYHRKHGVMKSNIMFYDDQDIRELIERIARNIGRRIDTQVPILDARLPDGTRVNATIPPISLDGSTITLRKFRKDPFSAVDLITFGTLNPRLTAFLWLAVDGMGVKPANILVSGGTASGKTSTLNVLSSFVPRQERILSIEDTSELNLPLEHWLRFEVRPPSLEGTGEVSMDDLVKNSLRMRPDRIIVGEIRGSEGYTMFAAMNTGHSGAASADQTVQMASGAFSTVGELFHSFSGEVKRDGGFEYLDVNGASVLCLNKQTLGLDAREVTRVWRREAKKDEELFELVTDGGRRVELTSDHPVYRLNGGGLMEQVVVGDLREGDWLCVPRKTVIQASSGLSVETAYCLGALLGDGNLNADGLNVSLDSLEVARAFEDCLFKSFGIEAKTKYYESRSSYKTVCYNRKLKNELVKLGVPEGRKTKTFVVPVGVTTSHNWVVAAFLRGLFDCDGFVNEHSKGVSLTLANEEACSQVKALLLRFGIQSRLYKAEKDGKGKSGPYWSVVVYGADNLRVFEDNIGFNHARKKTALSRLAAVKQNTNKDVVPAGRAIALARKKLGMTQEALSRRALKVKTRSNVRAYEAGVRHPSKETFKRVIAELKSEFNEQVKESRSIEEGARLLEARQLILHLQSLAREEVGFERVASLREKSAGDFVYDLTVDEHHTYLAGSNGGLFVSNCMGTVHANSARETLVRLESPPISVPKIMLTALNFVVMQNKIHDRKRGMLRRITEFAEVVPSDDGTFALQILYSWDPIKDEMKPTGRDSHYLQELKRYTGLSDEQIEEEITSRQEVLEGLVKRGEHNLEKVRKAMNDYSLKREKS